MEALAAFGIACNVIQVISFTRETISLCKTIYTSGVPFDNDGYINKIASDYTSICHDLQRQIKERGAGGCAEERELFSIAIDCLHAAEKLKSAAGKLVSPSVKGNALRSIYAGVAAKYKGGRLHKLETTLNKHQARLESHLLRKICKTTDATAIQQNEKFAALDTTLQTFIHNIANGYQNLESLLISQEAAINAHISMAVAVQATSIKKHITDELSQVHEAIAIRIVEKSQVARDYSNGLVHTSHARLLNSLKNSDLQSRKALVEVSHKGTFEWIYDSEKWKPRPQKESLESVFTDPPHSDHTCNPTSTARFDCLTCWLARPPGTAYWISGKAGSGKSTLTKFLISHAKTKQHLKEAHGTTLILSHFIWLSGTPIQRSLNGILLSLLYQFIHQDEFTENSEDLYKTPQERAWAQNATKLISKAVPGALHKDSAVDWSLDELKDALAALLNASPVAVCIFLDGLDEADTDPRSVDKSVLLLCDWLCCIPRIKLCVTSRPEPAFRSWFTSHPQLQLQDLTWDDIRAFVTDKLESQLVSDSSRRECDDWVIKDLTYKICRYSEGVFLWVCLVTKSLLRGNKNEDTLTQMHERLELLPRDLNELYQSMWQRLDEEDQEIYRREAALYVNLALEVTQRPTETTYLNAVQLCEAANPETAMRIFASPDSYPFKTLRARYAKFAKRLELVTAGLLEVTLDDSRDCTMPVGFVHRSAKEFFEGTPEGRKFLSVNKLERKERFERIVQGALVSIWYIWYRNISLSEARATLPLKNVQSLVKSFNEAFNKKGLDREQLFSLVYHCQQAYDESRRLVGHRREPIIWASGVDFSAELTDNKDFNTLLCRIGDRNLLASCLGTDLGSRESIEQILRDDLSSRRLPMVISQSYKAFLLQSMLRTDFSNAHQSALWMLDQGIFDNWPQGKEAAGLVQGLAGAAAMALYSCHNRDVVEWQNFEVLRRCLALDGAWGENVLFAFEEAVPRSAGCRVSRDLICGSLIPFSESDTSYIVQIQATMPFLVSSIIQTVARPDGGETLAIVKELEDEVSRRFPDGLPPAKMFSLHWDDYRSGGGKLGEYGFINISQETWSSLSLPQFNSLLQPGPPGPLQEAIQALNIESCETWDLEGIRQEMLKRILS